MVTLDGYAIRAEEYASFITRKKRPPHVTLARIANLAEKAMEYQCTLLVLKMVLSIVN